MSLLDQQAFATSTQFAVMGVPATVIRPVPDDDPVETTLIWLPTTDFVPSGNDFQRANRRRVAAVPINEDLTTLPHGSRITAAERSGGEAADWIVDSVLFVGTDHRRVLLIPAVDA